MDEDLWPEILKRLPIKSLYRFRSVCKGWNSLISSAFFINLHLSTRRTTPFNLKPYLHVTLIPRSLIPIQSLVKHHKCYTLCLPDINHSRQQLYCPFQAQEDRCFKRFIFVNVIHGVVCLSYATCSTHGKMSPSSHSVLLWNPSIHKYVSLPCLSLARRFNAIGFGYDARHNDFKVVIIWEPGASSHVTYQVYSARKGFWRSPVTATGIHVKHLCFQTDDHNCCFVNGSIHWLVSSDYDDPDVDGRYSVLMFDCEFEEFTSIDIPEKLFFLPCGENPITVELLEYGSMLAVLVEHCRGIGLWVMEEHGVSNSWKKLYSITLEWLDGYKWCITKYDPSFEKLTPYGPIKQWIDGGDNNFRCVMGDHVYEESMLLMDHPKALSYTKEEKVSVSTEDLSVPNAKENKLGESMSD